MTSVPRTAWGCGAQAIPHPFIFAPGEGGTACCCGQAQVLAPLAVLKSGEEDQDWDETASVVTVQGVTFWRGIFR